jgi:mannose-6-phosphate isomerase-like protein (cupin superfamily)
VEQALHFPDCRDMVIFSADRPQPQVLHEDDKIKVVVVGLEPSGQISVHPGDLGVYHFLEGTGQMRAGDETYAVQAGSTVVIPAGVTRSVVVHARLAFIAVRIAG